MNQLWKISSRLICTLLCATSFINCRFEHQRHPDRYLIPEGYIGWVKIEYEVSNAPPLPVDNGVYVYNIPPNGVFKTSSSLEKGWAKDEYLYFTGNSTHPLSSTISGGGGLIWGGNYHETSVKSEVVEKYSDFFVGTEAEYEKALLQKR